MTKSTDEKIGYLTGLVESQREEFVELRNTMNKLVEQNTSKSEANREEVEKLRNRVAILETKAGFIGGAAGFIVAASTAIAKHFLQGSGNASP